MNWRTKAALLVLFGTWIAGLVSAVLYEATETTMYLGLLVLSAVAGIGTLLALRRTLPR